MGTIGKDFKYKIIKNFLSNDEINLLKEFCKIRHRLNIDFKDPKVETLDTGFYADPIMESLLVNKTKLVSDEVGLELLPTYSFWRMYTKFADLKKHKDRQSCEISITTMIDGDTNFSWPIYIDGTEINLNIGDAAVYLGCDLLHWRDEFLGDYQSQVFLHYVNKNGKNKEFFKDKRILFGGEGVI